MTTTIAINGLGRIGRCVLRHYLLSDRTDVEVVAVNMPGDVNAHLHMLKYDSVHGVLPLELSITGDKVTAGKKSFKRMDGRDPAAMDWSNAAIVMECTGKFKEREKANLYLQGGAKKVMISAPAEGPDATIVMGVNHSALKKEHQVISIGSCTTNGLAPVAKVLNDSFGIESGFMTTIHAYTNDQNLVDGSHKDLRRARAAAMSMIPSSTGAAKALGEVLPELKGKLDGTAIRVPTPNVSLVDLVVRLQKSPSKDDIHAAMEAAAKGAMKGVLDVCCLPLVSVDFNGNLFSSTYDATQTFKVGENMFRVAAWYDNETGFSHRMLDAAAYWGGL